VNAATTWHLRLRDPFWLLMAILLLSSGNKLIT
jgi:hypothetical protein